MPIPLIWGIIVVSGFLAWGIFAAQYIWPAISKRERAEALKPILVLRGFRYVGLAVLIPGVVACATPKMLARPARLSGYLSNSRSISEFALT